MVEVRCAIRKCKYNENGYCTKKRIRLIRGRCADLRFDLTEFRGLTGNVVCTNYMCRYNKYGKCMAESILVLSDGCVMAYE